MLLLLANSSISPKKRSHAALVVAAAADADAGADVSDYFVVAAADHRAVAGDSHNGPPNGPLRLDDQTKPT